MNKLLKKALVLTVALCLILSAFIFSTSAAPATYSPERNSGTRGEICTTLGGTSAAEYYTGSYTYDNLSTLSETSLLNSLRKLMTDTHSYRSSYDDCRDYASYTDCENEDGRVLLIYTSYSATTSQYNGWNREHVWPQSLGGGNTSGGGADLHHIRPSDAGVNSSRGNKKYGEVGNGASSKYGTKPAEGYLGGYYNNTYFEPLDNVKGDVARICLYVYTRWGSNWGADSLTEVFQSIDVLLEWCALDPVDTWEMGRNEVVYGIQGNRNVFIDYPELAWIMLGEEVPDGLVTPSSASSGESGGSGSASCSHASTSIVNKLSATCEVNGYTGDVKCNNCKVIVTKGSVIAATGHSYGAETVTREPTATIPGSATKTCAKCSTVLTIVIPATGERLPIEIISNNVFYKDTLNLMYAVKADDGYGVALKIYNADGDLVEVITESKTETVNGENAKTFISKIGVPAQDIDTEFFAVAELLDGDEVVAETNAERYSVLEYLYERLTVSDGVTEMQSTMYKRLLNYANSADVVINKDTEESINTYAYVYVKDGTLDGIYNSAILKRGTVLAGVSAYDTEGKVITWKVVINDFVNAPVELSVSDEEISALTVEAGKTYVLIPNATVVNDKETVTVSKTAKEITELAGVSTASNGGSLNAKTVALDENVSIVCDKGDSTSAPAYYSGAIRLYQNGATLTVKSSNGAKIKTIIITVSSDNDGKGPISVKGGTASALTNDVYTITADEEATEIVITTTGTSKSARVYLASIEVVYEK